MTAFAVKHIARNRGPLVNRLSTYSCEPCSFTSKNQESCEAAKGNIIYVIEVRLISRRTTYWLGYKYVARKQVTHPLPGKWDGRFTYMNKSAAPPFAEGMYFDSPVQITNAKFCKWYARESFGMVELPSLLCAPLEEMFLAPGSGARKCA